MYPLYLIYPIYPNNPNLLEASSYFMQGGSDNCFCSFFFCGGIPIYFKRLPTSWSHLLYPSDVTCKGVGVEGYLGKQMFCDTKYIQIYPIY